MAVVATILVALVAAEHVGILVLEMFFWDHDVGRRVFQMTPEFSKASAVLAANQGLYNGFLAAGLIWGLLVGPLRPQGVLPRLRGGGGCVRRLHRQDLDPVHAGIAGSDCACGCADRAAQSLAMGKSGGR